MDFEPFLGPAIARYRTSMHVLHVLVQLSVGLAIAVVGIVVAILDDRPMMFLMIPVGAMFLAMAAVYLTWSASAFLAIHHGGVVIGRSFPGAARRVIRFREIHPASISVFRAIDSVRALPYRTISTRWYFSGGADLAITFLGPDLRSPAGPQLRPPAPGRGIILFGSRVAPEIAEQLRQGLERSGCPPHLARWSEQFGIRDLRGSGRMAQSSVPGMRADWTPSGDGDVSP